MRIGEVAAQSGISARMLRHYDRLGLVAPSARTSSQYREYSQQDVQRLFQVEGLRSLGLSLAEVADVLGGLSFSPGAMVDELIDRTRERLEREEELLQRLGQVRASDPGAWSDVLRLIELMRGLSASDGSQRQRVALSLTSNDENDASPLAEAALNETEHNVAGALAWALARTGDRAIPMLAGALESPHQQRRHRALEALEKIGSPEALAVIADAVRHDDPRVRRRAALARGARGDIDAIPALVDVVVGGTDDVEAAEELGRLAGRHDCADEIARRFAEELDGATGTIRQRIAGGLAEVPGQRARSILQTLSRDPDRGVAVTAQFVLRGHSTRSRS